LNMEAAIARRNAQTEGGDDVMVSPAQTPEPHQGTRAVARHAGPAFLLKTFAPHDTQSCIDPFTGDRVSIGAPLPMPEGLLTTRPCGGEQGGATPLETGVSRERSCVEAVMDYLDFGFPISEADVDSVIANDG